jgi:hypothetical protein
MSRSRRYFLKQLAASSGADAAANTIAGLLSMQSRLKTAAIADNPKAKWYERSFRRYLLDFPGLVFCHN